MKRWLSLSFHPLALLKEPGLRNSPTMTSRLETRAAIVGHLETGAKRAGFFVGLPYVRDVHAARVALRRLERAGLVRRSHRGPRSEVLFSRVRACT